MKTKNVVELRERGVYGRVMVTATVCKRGVCRVDGDKVRWTWDRVQFVGVGATRSSAMEFLGRDIRDRGIEAKDYGAAYLLLTCLGASL